MSIATITSVRSVRSAEIALERRALGLASDLPVAWLLIGIVAAINTASAVAMLSSF